MAAGFTGQSMMSHGFTSHLQQFTRPWILPPEMTRLAPACERAWAFSQSLLLILEQQIGSVQWPVEIDSLWLAGSLARREAGPNSDVDPIIIVANGVSPQHPAVVQAHAQYSAILSQTGLALSQKSGIYTQPISRDELLDPLRQARLDEDYATYGTRMALLLEAQPLTPGADAVQWDILRSFDSPAGYVVTGLRYRRLLDELIRYYKALSLRYQHEHRDHPARWRLRTLKGRFSRQLWYWGLIGLIVAAQTVPAEEQRVWWRAQLLRTPVERLAQLATACQSVPMNWLVSYDTFLEALQQADFRERLGQQDLPKSPEPLVANQLFQELARKSHAISEDATQMLLERYGPQRLAQVLG